MSSRITLLCPPVTAAMRAGCFPADEGLDPEQLEAIASLEARLAPSDLLLCSPARCAQQMARTLGRGLIVDPALREVDYGRWSGQPLKAIMAQAPAELALWLSDPGFAAHGGESLLAMLARAGHWFGSFDWPTGHTLIVTHASIAKAILLHVLKSPPQAYWQLDIAPLARIALSWQQSQWRVQLAPDEW